MTVIVAFILHCKNTLHLNNRQNEKVTFSLTNLCFLSQFYSELHSHREKSNVAGSITFTVHSSINPYTLFIRDIIRVCTPCNFFRLDYAFLEGEMDEPSLKKLREVHSRLNLKKLFGNGNIDHSSL